MTCWSQGNQQLHHWIWKIKNWPHVNCDSDLLLTNVATASRLIGELEAISKTIGHQKQLHTLETVLSENAMETSALESDILRLNSVRTSIRKQIGLPVEKDDWDTRAYGLITMLLDARGRAGEPLTTERLFGWHTSM